MPRLRQSISPPRYTTLQSPISKSTGVLASVCGIICMLRERLNLNPINSSANPMTDAPNSQPRVRRVVASLTRSIASYKVRPGRAWKRCPGTGISLVDPHGGDTLPALERSDSLLQRASPIHGAPFCSTPTLSAGDTGPVQNGPHLAGLVHADPWHSTRENNRSGPQLEKSLLKTLEKNQVCACISRCRRLISHHTTRSAALIL